MSYPPNQVTIYQDSPNQVLVTQENINRVVVRSTTPGALSTKRFIFSQDSPSDVWVIPHTLIGNPSVTIVDSSNTVVVGEVRYDSNSQVTVFFSAPFSGKAYLT
jgi:hypothetical protein